MAVEYTLSLAGAEIDEKLKQVDTNTDNISNLSKEIDDLKSVQNGETKKVEMLSEAGFTEGMRVNSSGSIVVENGQGSDVTGYIPVKVGDIILIENMQLPSSYNEGTYWSFVAGYDSNKTYLAQTQLITDYTGFGDQLDAVSDGTNIIQFTIKESFFGSNVAYIVLSAKEITSESKVYVVSKTSAENSEMPSYWVEELEAKADTIQQAMETAGRNKSAFLWYTDAHWQNNSKVSPLLLKYLYDNTPMNKINFGGDIVCDPSVFTHENIGYVYEWRKLIADLPNHHSVFGNHDLNHWTTDVSNIAYTLLMAHEESSNMVVGGNGFYYIDNPSEKTRYLYLSYLTSDHDEMAAQGEFIVDAIKGVSEGWHIVVIAHRWFQYTSSSAPTVGSVPNYESEILKIFDEYNARGTHTASNYFTTQDFTDCKGKVEFCIGGHIHVDYDFETDGGIPVIITASDTNQERSSDEEEDCGTVGTITESAVYGIIADYDNSKITVVGVGRGGSRDITITEAEVEAVNLFDSTDSDMLDRGRINSSHVTIAYADNQLVTGYIEARIGDTFEITTDKANNANNYTGAAYCWDENKAYVGGNMERATAAWTWSDDYLTGTFTIPETYQFSSSNIVDFTGTAYIRFCLAYTDMANIVITKK